MKKQPEQKAPEKPASKKGAPKGNQFWKLRSKHGRDKIFKTPEILLQAAYEYFEWCENNPIKAEDNKGTKNINIVKFKRPFTLKGFCIYCGASESWFKEYRKAITDKDFLSVIHIIEEIIYTQKFEGAAIGIYNANIIARDLGLSDQQKVDLSGKVNLSFDADDKEA